MAHPLHTNAVGVCVQATFEWHLPLHTDALVDRPHGDTDKTPSSPRVPGNPLRPSAGEGKELSRWECR
jgi:hypothetical protein